MIAKPLICENKNSQAYCRFKPADTFLHLFLELEI